MKASNSETKLLILVAAMLVILTGYKIIAKSGKLNKTSDNKAL